MSRDRATYVVYDGECPFCSRFVAMLRLKQAVGPVELVDARSNHPVVAELVQRGIDLDQGMALVQGAQIAHGADCMHRLALMTTPSNLFNRLNAIVFRSPVLARLLYPILRFGRNLTLAALGRRRLSTKASTNQSV